jgi:glyoxylase-like metal-dependent hydrolase (beta-lactamase superfamily II)
MPPRDLIEVMNGVWVATSRLYQTSSTLVTTDGTALLVDPAWTPAELEGLAATIADLELTVTAGYSTHAHFDHLLWHADYGAPPRWATRRTVELAHERQEHLLKQLGEPLANAVGDTFARVFPLPGDHLPNPFGPDGPDEPIEVIVHDAHCQGHGALWFPERRLLLAADMLSDFELPLPFDPDDLSAYLTGLERLAPYVERATHLITGHGSPTDRPVERLDADRRLLDELLAGRDVADPRRAGPGGEETYQKLREMALQTG